MAKIARAVMTALSIRKKDRLYWWYYYSQM